MVMAEAWLKVRHSLLRSAKVRALMRELRCKKHAALGLAVAWLVWIDEQTTDGQTHLLPDELDDEIGFRGCAEALISIGWAALGEDGCVYALEFGKHCGDSAKERAQGARRVERHRKQGAKNGNAECNGGCNGESVTKTLPDKNRIYNDKVELSSTVVTGAPAEPCATPPLSWEESGDFGSWLVALGEVVPMLGRLNLDHPLPRKVEEEALRAYRLVPMSAVNLRLLQRYYAAEDVRSYRPESLEFFFRDLPDVLQHATSWCRHDDTRQRKKAAAERVRAKERANAVQNVTDAISAEEAEAEFAAMRKELRP